jgi:hypothetical protein
MRRMAAAAQIAFPCQVLDNGTCRARSRDYRRPPREGSDNLQKRHPT